MVPSTERRIISLRGSGDDVMNITHQVDNIHFANQEGDDNVAIVDSQPELDERRVV